MPDTCKTYGPSCPTCHPALLAAELMALILGLAQVQNDYLADPDGMTLARAYLASRAQVADLRRLLDDAYVLIYAVGSFGTPQGQREVVRWIGEYRSWRQAQDAPSAAPQPADNGSERER